LPTNQEASFYVATLKEMPADLHQPQFTLPQLLRGMPKSRLRIPYIKALQLLADGFKQDVKAVEVSELLN
jgi:hypothetical protein